MWIAQKVNKDYVFSLSFQTPQYVPLSTLKASFCFYATMTPSTRPDHRVIELLQQQPSSLASTF